jgi:hypothetical protein
VPDSPPVGTQAKLHAPNSKPIPIALDEKTLSDAIKAARAKDEYATQEMLGAGKIFTVSDNTKVLIIDSNLGVSKVRVLEGPYSGKAGWVIVEWVIALSNQSSEIRDIQPVHPSAGNNSSDLNKAELNRQLFARIDKILSTEIGERETIENANAVEALIKQGADVNAKYGDETPVLMAARNGYIKSLLIFLNNGADINAQNEGGVTALMMAANVNDVEMTRLLLAHGAKVNIKDNNGYTAWSGSEAVGGSNDPNYLRMRKLLKRAGAK